MAKKTALEQALLESEEIVNIVTENAKKMLFNQIEPQINKGLSEGLEDLLGDKKEDEDEVAPDAVSDDAPKDDSEEVSDEVVSADDTDTETDAVADDSQEGGLDLGDEVSLDKSGEEAPEGDLEVSDEIPTDGVDVTGEPAIDTEVSDEIGNVLDATNMSDDDLIKVFKKVSDTTEIEVVKNPDETLSIKKDGEEFIVKLNENEDKASFLDAILSDNGGEDEKDEVIYEITLDEDEIEGTLPTLDSTPENEPIEEVARTHSDGRNMTRKPEGFYNYASSRLRSAMNESAAQSKGLLTEAAILKAENAQLIKEAAELKTDLSNHKDALRLMKENLELVALTNHKLLYVNKIFCENATTLAEKKTIVERFDAEEITDQKDVKTLYKTIVNEMKQTIKESVESRLITTVDGTGKSLLESVQTKATNPQLERIKQLMGTTYKK